GRDASPDAPRTSRGRSDAAAGGGAAGLHRVAGRSGLARRAELCVALRLAVQRSAGPCQRRHRRLARPRDGAPVRRVSRDHRVLRYGYLSTLDAAAGPPVGRPATWSTVGRLHLVKTVQCLLLADELGESGMRDAARVMVDATRRAFSLRSEWLREGNGEINLH